MQVITSDGCVRCVLIYTHYSLSSMRDDAWHFVQSICLSQPSTASHTQCKVYDYDSPVNAMRLKRVDSHEKSTLLSVARQTHTRWFILYCLYFSFWFHQWPNSSQRRTTFPLKRKQAKKKKQKIVAPTTRWYSAYVRVRSFGRTTPSRQSV